VVLQQVETKEEITNVNIWEEPIKKGCHHLILNNSTSSGWPKPNQSSPTLIGYTLNALVIQLTSETDYGGRYWVILTITDSEFIQTFLQTYESFATPEILLSKLIERFAVPEKIPRDKKLLIQMRVVTVLKHWIEGQVGVMYAVLIASKHEAELVNIKQQLIEFLDGMSKPELGNIVQKVRKLMSDDEVCITFEFPKQE
jgi:hypothetical protein